MELRLLRRNIALNHRLNKKTFACGGKAHSAKCFGQKV
jgi:hypothetical protein